MSAASPEGQIADNTVVDKASTAADETGRLGAAIAGIAALWVVARWWLGRVNSGFHVDETLTAWITADSIGDAWTRAFDFQGNGPLYFVFIWCWRQIFGASELALRIPSVLAMLAAAWLITRLVRRFGGDVFAAAVAVAVFVAVPTVAFQATAARPYAFQLLFVCFATWMLVTWSDTGRVAPGFGWAASMAGAVYMHPIVALLGVGHLAYLFVQRSRGGLATNRQIVSSLAVGAVLAAPLVPQILSLPDRGDEWSFAALPGTRQVMDSMAPRYALFALALGFVFSFVKREPRDHTPRLSDRTATILMLAFWIVLPPLVVYGLSHLTGNSIYVPRYLVFVAPATAIAVGLVLKGLASPLGRLVAVSTLALLMVFSLSVEPSLGSQLDWRAPMTFANDNRTSDDAVLLAYTGLIETESLRMLDDPTQDDYLAAPASYYWQNPIRVIPRTIDDDAARSHLHDLVLEVAPTTSEIQLLSPAAEFSGDYAEVVSGALDGEQWELREQRPFEGLVVTIFDRVSGP